MGSTMRFWKNADLRAGPGGWLAGVLAAGILLAVAGAVLAAEGIRVDYASSGRDETSLLLNARLHFDFDEEVYEALEHGVELNFTVTVQVRREREWLWDPVIAEQTFDFILEHHPLTDDYGVTDLQTGARRQFPDAREALAYMGTLRDRHLAPVSDLSPDSTYHGRIRARLNLEHLPAPLQPVAYVSRKWRMESQWYRWEVR